MDDPAVRSFSPSILREAMARRLYRRAVVTAQITVPAVPIDRLAANASPVPESSATVRARVESARTRQRARYRAQRQPLQAIALQHPLGCLEQCAMQRAVMVRGSFACIGTA